MQQPIKVIRVITRMNLGGPATQLYGLMHETNDTFSVHTLIYGKSSKNETEFLDDKNIDFDLIKLKYLQKKFNPFYDFFIIVQLIVLFRKVRPDIIHTHTTKAGMLGRVASLISLHNSLLVHTFHGHLLFGYFGRFKRTIIILLEKQLSKYTDYHLAVGHKVRQSLLDAGIGNANRFGVMYPGVGEVQLVDRDQAIRDLGLKGDKLRCAFIGRLTKIKRVDRFLDAVELFNLQETQVEFLLVGGGELFQWCFEEIRKRNLPIKMLGWQKNIDKILSVTDIVVSTSDNEGMPIILIEAGMHGLPVIATNVGSVSEVILDGITGLLTQPDPKDIALALKKLVFNKKLRQAFGSSAKTHTTKKFSTSNLAKNHYELYLNLLKNRPNS